MQIFLYVPASKFALPPDRSYRCGYYRRAAGDFTSAPIVLCYLPDMLTVRTQAIEGTGTFTLSDSQPCRLLTSLHEHYTRFITRSAFPKFESYHAALSSL